MDRLFKGYVETNGKKSFDKIKGAGELKAYESVRKCHSFAGVLRDDIILVDVDTPEEVEILERILADFGIETASFATNRGRHWYFKQPVNEQSINFCKGNSNKHFAAIGIKPDYKVGIKHSYGILKFEGKKRRQVSKTLEPSEMPFWLTFIKGGPNFRDFGPNSGRNSALFSHILVLQKAGFSVEEIKIIIKIINKYVIKEPLDEREIETILRDEAFKENVFMVKGKFKSNEFAKFLQKEKHIIKLKGRLHVYEDGVYTSDIKAINRAMLGIKDDLSINAKREIVDYLKDKIKENSELLSPDIIPFSNGLYDINSKELKAFSPEYITVHKIPWNYNPNAYYELTDKTLDKLACNVPEIRLLLEEMIGYCFYRKNSLRKAFMLLGDKRNGKSTFLDTVKELLGSDNYKSLDLKDLGNRFKTAELCDKLANIGDDIGDDFIPDMSVFKKLTSGESVNAERKGQDPFDFSNYAKLIFSANELPRIKDNSGAAIDRLILIPFNAEFKTTDPDFNPNIKEELIAAESMEYLIKLGLEGLHRVLANKRFTEDENSKRELEEYHIYNNPVIDFFTTVDVEKYIESPTEDLYKKYKEYCLINNCMPESKVGFSRKACKYFKILTKVKKFDGGLVRIFTQSA